MRAMSYEQQCRQFLWIHGQVFSLTESHCIDFFSSLLLNSPMKRMPRMGYVIFCGISIMNFQFARYQMMNVGIITYYLLFIIHRFRFQHGIPSNQWMPTIRANEWNEMRLLRNECNCNIDEIDIGIQIHVVIVQWKLLHWVLVTNDPNCIIIIYAATKW